MPLAALLTLLATLLAGLLLPATLLLLAGLRGALLLLIPARILVRVLLAHRLLHGSWDGPPLTHIKTPIASEVRDRRGRLAAEMTSNSGRGTADRLQFKSAGPGRRASVAVREFA